MKNRSLILLILGFLLAKTASSQTSGGDSSLMSPELYNAFGSVITLTGYPAQDVAWPGYRLLDANGIMRVLSDVTGPAAPLESYSTSSQHMWWTGFTGADSNFRIQTRYADFGGTCDLNNPDRPDTNAAATPAPNYANGLFSAPAANPYQSGPFNTCGTNSHLSQNNFSPLPLTTRAAWMYRACRRIGAEASSAQITTMMERVRVPDPTPTPIPVSGVGTAVVSHPAALDGYLTNPALSYNWCTRISAPVESDYQAIFRAFYPGRNIPQIIDPTRSQPALKSSGASIGRPVHPSAALLGLGVPSARAQLAIPVGVVNPSPQFREHLMELVTQSNQYIDTLPSVGPSRWQTLENNCMPGQGTPPPNKDQVKAVAAWRALFITMCMDPGWQVL